MNKPRCRIWFVAAVMLLGGFAFALRPPADPRIHPERDFVYLGAFRLPNETSNGSSWSYGGSGMSYHPGGDPHGGEDGFPGTLFSIGHPHQHSVSAFDIPAPVISAKKAVEELPVARTMVPFVDVTGGRLADEGQGSASLGDIQYMAAISTQTNQRLYWMRYIYYMPPTDYKTLGWWELDDGKLVSRGPWRLGKYNSAATSKYLFEIPQAWADTYVNGSYLASGQCRINNGGSWGPSLYTTAPWKKSGVPRADDRFDAFPLLGYDDAHTLADFSMSDEWTDGAWLTVGDKQAVIFAGTKALRTVADGTEYYGDPGPDGCRSKGYQAEPYYSCILFYDAEDLAQVARGKAKAYKPQPYVRFQIENYLFRAPQNCRYGMLGGVGFDRERGLLYVVERYVEGVYDLRPIVHVWRLQDSGLEPDREPPTTPAGLKVDAKSSSRIGLSWEASTDASGSVMYVVYRNGSPIAVTTKPSCSDEKVGSYNLREYRYKVEARDGASNRSPQSAELVVTPG